MTGMPYVSVREANAYPGIPWLYVRTYDERGLRYVRHDWPPMASVGYANVSRDVVGNIARARTLQYQIQTKGYRYAGGVCHSVAVLRYWATEMDDCARWVQCLDPRYVRKYMPQFDTLNGVRVSADREDERLGAWFPNAKFEVLS